MCNEELSMIVSIKRNVYKTLRKMKSWQIGTYYPGR